MEAARNSLHITFAVWKALFLREALARLFAGRAAWFWLLAEPVSHIVFLMVIFSAIRIHTVGGIDTGTWIMVGLLSFFVFRRTATQVTNAVNANQALFTYRQVKPVDAALVRGMLEGFLMALVTGVLLFGYYLARGISTPSDVLAVLGALTGLWLFGLGFGLIMSVVGELVPEVARVVNLAMTPLYLASGAMFPLTSVPASVRSWLLLNPVAHGMEAARLGFVSHYHAVSELSLGYLFGSALVTIFLGLALHRRFAVRLSTQ
jgi:capsular polysaccharide transport system permease protein